MLHLLDEESRFPKGSDLTYIEKLAVRCRLFGFRDYARVFLRSVLFLPVSRVCRFASVLVAARVEGGVSGSLLTLADFLLVAQGPSIQVSGAITGSDRHFIQHCALCQHGTATLLCIKMHAS